jgi:ketosteroid isomerase-like protein
LSPAPTSAPAASLQAFLEALNQGNLGAVAACLCRDARLITGDRTAVSGREDIGRILAQLIDSRALLALDNEALTEAAEVALLTAGLTTDTPRPEGVIHTQHSDLTAVLRLIEGEWKLAILAPWGQPSG